jgi:hypothetical protein
MPDPAAGAAANSDCSRPILQTPTQEIPTMANDTSKHFGLSVAVLVAVAVVIYGIYMLFQHMVA